MPIPTSHVIFVLDGSGSMSSHTKPTQDAFNVFVGTLKECKGAEIRMTLIVYKKKPHIIWSNKPIQDVDAMTDYEPNSDCDALYDSVKKACEIATADTRSTKVVICIQGDGGDNISTFSQEDCAKLIAKQRAKGWEFNYLAAGHHTEEQLFKEGRTKDYVDIYGPGAVARRLGIPNENILVYTHDQKVSREAFERTALGAAKFSSGRASSTAYEKT